MAATPFAFLRGSAGLMAHDLARTPMTGIGAQICGDAHAANFGLYGDARGGLVIDLNDFDETVHGPWEWDLKRLAASLVLAGREAGADEDICREAAHDAVGRVPADDAAAGQAPGAGRVERHRRRGTGLAHGRPGSARARWSGSRRRRGGNTSARFAAKSTEATEDGGRRFVDAPPVLRRVPDAEAAAVAASLERVPGHAVARTGCRCWPGTRCTTWPSAWSAPAAWAPGRTWCCCWTTGASRWCSR